MVDAEKSGLRLVVETSKERRRDIQSLVQEYFGIFQEIAISGAIPVEKEMFKNMGVNADLLRNVLAQDQDQKKQLEAVKQRECRLKKLRERLQDNVNNDDYKTIISDEMLSILEKEYGRDDVDHPKDIQSVPLIIEDLEDIGYHLDWPAIFTIALSYVAKSYPPNLQKAVDICAIAADKRINIMKDNSYLCTSWEIAIQRSVVRDSSVLRSLVEFIRRQGIIIDWKSSYIKEACRTALQHDNSQAEKAEKLRLWHEYFGLTNKDLGLAPE